LDWDEEYLQSANAPAHRSAAERLFAEGRAYYCDCATEQVQARKPAGAPPGYDGFCRDRGLEPAPGRALRFRVPPGRTVIDDVVRGRVEFENDKLGGDFVIVKGNGGPIFYLANTVDDLDERISHVLRGEEHLANAPKNQLLWEALAPADVPPPTWAHLPNLVNERRQKLSKRRDKVALESFREEGYLMEAVRNYLCLLGWAPKGDREFLTLDEMLAEFRLEDVNSSPAFFDVKKLTAFNEHYLRALPAEAFLAQALAYLGPTIERATPLVQTRLRTLAELPGMVGFLFGGPPPIDVAAWEKDVAGNPAAAAILGEARDAYAGAEWGAAALHELTEAIGERHGIPLRKAQAPIRVAVTGRTVGPPLFESLELRGRERTISRLEGALDRLQGAGRS
ncbi:MAG TPA: glutamate--tRNA ligase family protein, partial [Acidimicrobiales bacterium]